MVQERFPFDDGRELFDTGLKYLTNYKLIENTWRTKIFEFNTFVIHKVLPKFMKILSHEYKEPYGMLSACVWLANYLNTVAK